MKIYIVQHGKSIEDENGNKILSDEGILETNKAAHLAKEHYQIAPKRIYTSKKERSIQTADIFCDVLKPKQCIKQDGLAPMDKPADMKCIIESLNEDIMIIGHLPNLSKLISVLLKTDIDMDILSITNSCIVCLEKEDKDYWLIDWVMKV